MTTATRSNLLRSPGERMSSTIMEAEEYFDAAAILREFEGHRKQLMTEATGSGGAFTGFARLDTRPADLRRVPVGASIVVTTRLRTLSDRQNAIEVEAHDVEDPSHVFLEGFGICLRTTVEGEGSL